MNWELTKKDISMLKKTYQYAQLKRYKIKAYNLAIRNVINMNPFSEINQRHLYNIATGKAASLLKSPKNALMEYLQSWTKIMALTTNFTGK